MVKDVTGYVYCFINSTVPGFCKIGCTEQNPQERAKSLSNGTPEKYKVIYYIYVRSCYECETIIFNTLKRKGIEKKKEFFRCDPKDVEYIFTPDFFKDYHIEEDIEKDIKPKKYIKRIQTDLNVINELYNNLELELQDLQRRYDIKEREYNELKKKYDILISK
jgi:hypothetical protein